MREQPDLEHPKPSSLPAGCQQMGLVYLTFCFSKFAGLMHVGRIGCMLLARSPSSRSRSIAQR